jgi:hypothetical protein
MPQIQKSFLVLFFKKEPLPFAAAQRKIAGFPVGGI